jgi:FkbM family methyltransferase
MKILVHTSFIGDTGYNNHARSFFTALNKYHKVKIRNFTVGKTWKNYSRTCHDSEPYMTDEMREMLILQTLFNNDGTRSDFPLYNYNGDFKEDVNIILNDVNHYYFYENYTGYTIGYNVWETTKYPKDFLEQIKKFNEFWVPSEWQKNNLIKQGYPEYKIKVVPEGVDGEVFNPETKKRNNKEFTFALFGRWEYRKSTKEIIETFTKTFGEDEPVQLLVSADNNFANDGFNTTEERLLNYNINHKGINVIHFPSRDKYVSYLKGSDVFVSCARSEGWNLPLIEAMACGTPSIYSNWGAQLQFAKGKGVPVKTLHEVSAKTQDPSFVGNYIEPDFDDLSKKMRDVYEKYKFYKLRSINESKEIRESFDWDVIAKKVSEELMVPIEEKIEIKDDLDFVFVTTGNISYMPVIEKLVQSLQEFSEAKIIVYGVNCEIPFDYPNVIKRTLVPPYHSIHDKWYWKQYACIESLKENYKNYIWIDGDTVVNFNIDTVQKYFDDIENYPLSDIHRQEEFYGYYKLNDETFNQSFNENLSKLMKIDKKLPYMHVCFFIYDKKCKWWFEEVISIYKSIDLKDYSKYLLWNDEGIENILRWKYNFTKHLPLSNFDTSSYDGDAGQTQNQLIDFYTFWNEKGPYNFNRVYGYQYIPKEKSDIIYFHGNKNDEVSDKMIEFIKMKRDDSFYKSEQFYVSKNNLVNLGKIKNEEGWTIHIASKYDWAHAIYHEIYNLQDYYHDRVKRIFNGDIVVDLGGNIGIFNRWAYSQGAEKVISFEPDKRYFELLSKNTDPKSILFNAAVSDKMSHIDLYESDHLGGSNIFLSNTNNNKHYKVRTYTLDYLFETGLIDHIDFLKVDIEGAEQLAFNGISDENLNKVKNISMEYHHSHFGFDEELRTKFISRLNRLGFHSHLLFLGDNNQLQLIYFWK